MSYTGANWARLMRSASIAVLAIGVLTAYRCCLEPALGQELAFEVTSVRRSGASSVRGTRGGPGTSDPGRYSFGNATLLDLIAIAYDVEYFQVVSSTPLDLDRYDVAVILPSGTTKQEFGKMLQRLLSERFDLRVRLGSREFSIYELTVAKSGAKFKDGAADPGRPSDSTPGIRSRLSVLDAQVIVHLAAEKVTMDALTRALRSSLDAPVVDTTGLAGTYSFVLDFGKDLPQQTDTSVQAKTPDLFAALRQQLGLNLRRGKAPFDVVIVERFNRDPTPN